MNTKMTRRIVLMTRLRVSRKSFSVTLCAICSDAHTFFLLDEGEAVDDERESGDGQEELESEGGSKKPVDHDEDRSNPQYIPKKGTFYEHDDRTVEDLDAAEPQENLENPANSNEALSNSSKILSTLNQKVTPKQIKKPKDADRWSHDRFNENEQAPKSRSELVSAYGYDIRNEDCAPRPRRPRRYGRHQSKYDRNWEDEEAYKKTQAMKTQTRRPLRPEDFPALGANKVPSKPRRRSSRQQDENDPQSSSNYRSPVRNRDQRPREDRGMREPRSQRYNNDTSNNNNARNVKGKRNINFNHNIEYKNQNRKNINYETPQPKNNNVLNQQMQSSTSSQHGQPPQGGSQPQSGPRFNNEASVSTMSFTNSKMNNANNNSNAQQSGSSRTILNFDNSSGNYGRGSREKEVNSQQQHQMHQQQQQQQQMSAQGPVMSPNKNLQYTDHQLDQMKLMEKNYQQQQGKATNLNLNQVAQHQQPMNNVQDAQMMNNSEMTRAKRYSSTRLARTNVNETPAQSAPYHQPYHQQEIDPAHVPSVMPAQQAPQAYIPQQQQQVPPAAMMAAQTVPQPAAPGSNVQQPPPTQKYQAAYYAANPANEYAAQQAAMMNAMVEKYQYQQQPTPPQYLPPQQAQQIYMPTQNQPAQQQQILNYVSTIQPQAPASAPNYPQYQNYQNYNIQAPAAASAPPPPTQAPPQPQTAAQPIFQTTSGLTYYPNAQIAPTHPPRIIQPQR
jgi:protein CASC3